MGPEISFKFVINLLNYPYCFHDSFNSAVLLTTFYRIIAGNRFSQSITGSGYAGTVNSEFVNKVLTNAVSAFFG
jgi:hypothetical protein